MIGLQIIIVPRIGLNVPIVLCLIIIDDKTLCWTETAVEKIK